ncbi:transporter substrate-binding domain-containing protein [Grimontia kaedaensis]|uniref:Transporter substrate-binding domain-containing protein n=1 Tax=Grimontia kaedaensis TaxID=2872157 RepID=A0ABY4WZV7_9GAMM|nr:transporter substrate-binding domain-containing protein [Grimontia kaedaensis]USH04505.1 transporter substrate-binding domain-containing protein [Grimontia kaedaensis]
MTSLFARKLAYVFAFTLAAFIALPSTANPQGDKEIILVSEAWEDATEKDGSGLYFEIMRRVFEPLGYSIKTITTTYSRSIYLVQTKRMDAFLGSYIDEQEKVLYPYWHFDAEQVSAVYKASVIPTWKGEETLEDRTVGWVKGYDYNHYIDTKFTIHEVKSRRQGLSMVYSDRLDFLIDAREELVEEFELGYLNRDEFEMANIMDLKLYPGFADTEKGQELRRIYDERFEELLNKGEIKRLFDEYEWEYFPFAVRSTP